MQTLNSKAVAEMLGKRHDNFKRELRKYVATLGEAAGEYFLEGTYKDAMGRERSGYLITLKGCELIAGRMIGVKSDDGSYGNRKAATVAHLSNQFRSGQIQSLGIVLDVLYLIGFMT